MISVIFTPLYLLQYFSVFILVLQGVYLLGIILVVLSMITTSGNYIALYLSNKKIKEIAEKTHPVQILRSGRIQVIDSREIVPGDVLIV
jgi:magnesium-transporting ATPase (P-type)